MKIGIWANTAKKVFWDILPELMDWLKGRGHEVFLTTRVEGLWKDKDQYTYSIIYTADEFPKIDFLLAMGGDGTILSAARHVAHRNTPILGIHLGGLGFLAEVTLDDFYPRLEKVLTGESTTFQRMVLEGEVVDGENRIVHVLNDLVVDRGDYFRLIKCSLFTNNRLITTYITDGLIISTPTGSTAYNLSAGGPIVAPWLSLITITPICPHTLSARPIVLPAENELKVTFPDADKIRLTVDGQEKYDLSPDATLYIRRAPYDIHLITFEDRDYFQTLRTKLGLGQE